MSNEEPLAVEKPAHDKRANQLTPNHDVNWTSRGLSRSAPSTWNKGEAV